jgi:cell division protein FtsZ
MNLDFADMRAIMKDGGVCAIGFGEGSGDSKVEDAVEQALDSQLLDIGDIRKTKGALIHIEGGEDMTLEDVNRAGELVLEKISPSARVTWGAMVDRDLKGMVRVTVVLAGVESPFLKEKPKAKQKSKQETPKIVAKKSGKGGKKTLKVSRSPPKKA